MEKNVQTYDEKKLDQLPIVVLDQASKKLDPKEEKFLREYVMCEFSNVEEPGLMQTFVYGNTKQMQKFSFMHGGKYRLPRHVMQHINRVGTPIYKYKPDGSGQVGKSYAGKKNRFMMQQIG